MKLKRLLPLSLLMGSLLLTSCEDLINNFLGGNNRNKSNSDNSDIYGGGYQGKQGATELNEDEWNQAFSLEEFALRRSCHLKATRDSVSIDMDVDNGKFKIDMSYPGMTLNEGYTYYFSFAKSVRADYITGTAYYQNSNGGYETSSGEDKIAPIMMEFGVLTYNYKDFKYDSKDKQYTASSFTYSVEESETTIIGKNAVIKIEDGFPKSIDFDVENLDGEEGGHYTATYSNYNKTTVTLPDLNGGNNNQQQGGNQLPTPDGEQITYNDLYLAYQKREIVSFNHVSYEMNSTISSYDITMSYSGAKIYNYGMWETERGDEDFDIDVEDLIIDDEMIVELKEVPDADEQEIEYYYDKNNDEYIVHAYYSAMNTSISTNIYINKYFYVNAEFVVMDDSYSSLELEWSNVTVNKPMNVTNRTFKGVDIEEKNFIYYTASKEVAEGITLRFDDEYCEMSMSKASSGNVVTDIDQVMVGTYSQSNTTVTATFDYFSDGVNGYQELPAPVTYTFIVAEDKLSLLTQNMDDNNQPVDIHIIFSYEEPMSGYIYYPGGSTNIEESNLMDGYYQFNRFECTLEDESNNTAKQAALDYIAQYDSNNLYATMYINIDTESEIFMFMDSVDAIAGRYTEKDGVITVNFIVKMKIADSSDYESVDFTGTYYCMDDEISYNIYEGDGFSVNVVYKHFDI